MRHAVLAIVFLTAAVALAGSVVSKSFGVTGGSSFTGTAPDGGFKGVDLVGARYYAVTVATSAQSDGGRPAFMGAGSLLCYYKGPTNSTGIPGQAISREWARCASSLDVASIPSGQTSYTAPAYTASGTGEVMYVPSGVTTDGGAEADGGPPTTLRVTVEAYKESKP